MYTGYTYAGILGQTGTLSVRWLKRGAIGGFAGQSFNNKMKLSTLRI